MARKQNPPLPKIDKLVYSHAVSCLISELTNHKLKVSGFSCNTPLLLHHLLSGWSCDCAQAGIQTSAQMEQHWHGKKSAFSWMLIGWPMTLAPGWF